MAYSFNVVSAKLILADNSRELAASHRTFADELVRWKGLAVDLVRRTQYWVYDPASRTFSPSKFSGYVAMSFQRYGAAREGRATGVKFDSGVAQRAITQVLGEYQADDALAYQLVEWVESIFGDEVLADIDRTKWRFVRLPTAGAGGLAALAGGWEGSDELVDLVDGLRRTPGREAPDVE